MHAMHANACRQRTELNSCPQKQQTKGDIHRNKELIKETSAETEAQRKTKTETDRDRNRGSKTESSTETPS